MTALPLGGRALWDIRVAGQRPAEMVVVSLLTPARVSNPVLWIAANLPDAMIPRLEWRMLADLDVEIDADGSTPIPRLLTLTRAVLGPARDVFIRYPDAGFRIAVRWLDPRLPVRVVDLDKPESKAIAGAVVRRLISEGL